MADPVADALALPDSFGPFPAGKRPTLSLPNKSTAMAANSDPVAAALALPDSFKAPVKPTDTIQPEGGGADYLYGGLQGLYNTGRGLVTGAAGQAAGLLDIPVHAAGTAMGFNMTEPEDVERKVQDLGRMTPSTRTGERAGQFVEDVADTALSLPGKALAAADKYLEESKTTPGGVSVRQAMTGIPDTSLQYSRPQTEYEKGISEAVGNGLAMVAGARAPAKAVIPDKIGMAPRGGTPESTGYEEPPSQADPEFVNIHGKTEYTPPVTTGEKRAPTGIQADVRAAYDKLTPEEKEETPVRDQLTGAFSPAMYKRMAGPDKPQVFIDLRGFKQLQEPPDKPVSHGFGDQLLTSLGKQAKALGIPLFRTGGDEFAILGDRDYAMGDARRLQDAMRGHTVRYTAKDGTVYEGEVRLDYGYGKNRDAADAASQAAKKANKASGYAPGRDDHGVAGEAASGREGGDRTSPPDRSRVSRLLADTNARLTPFKAEQAPRDIQWNSVELEPGLGDVRLPQRNIYASPADEFLQKLGESQYGHAIRGEKFRVDPAVLQEFRRLGQQGHFPWWQDGGKGMLANIAHAVDIASERRQTRQKAYRTLADEVGTREMLKNAPDYALTFDWRKDEPKARPSEIVCGDL